MNITGLEQYIREIKMPGIAGRNDLREVSDYIETLPKEHRAMAYIVFGMAMNTVSSNLKELMDDPRQS